MSEAKFEIREATLSRISQRWSKRAVVKGPEVVMEDLFHLDLPDYPLQMLPFHDHPDFTEAPKEKRDAVLSWGWIAYNERTVAAEDHIANPAFFNIMQGIFPGSEHPAIRNTVGQALVDEHFHTLLHVNAMALCRKQRNLSGLSLPPSIAVRAMRDAQGTCGTQWEKDLVQLCFAITSEISINAYLNLMAHNTAIQPLHSKITDMHNRDEFGHMILLVEVARVLYGRMDKAQRNMFRNLLPVALDAYLATDFVTWEKILTHVGFKRAKDIVVESASMAGRTVLTRDYSGLKLLVDSLGIADEFSFDFGRASHKHGSLWRKLKI